MLWCWGSNSGTLGVGPGPNDEYTFVSVMLEPTVAETATKWKAVSVSSYAACGIPK